MIWSSRLVRPIALLVILIGVAGFINVEQPQASGNTDCSAAANAACNVVEGFKGNTVSPDTVGVTISGGGDPAFLNRVTGNYGTVSGGLDNQASDRATVGGGAQNVANGLRSTISGGFNNFAPGENSTIGGGYGNIAGSIHSTVAGGVNNTASAWDANIGGGSGNNATYHLSTVGGGSDNTASNLNATVSGGESNIASGPYSTVAGGSANTASGIQTAVSGGAGNKASGENAFVGGGLANRATAKSSTVAGGWGNLAGTEKDNQTENATVGGGLYNTAGGFGSLVPGGVYNSAAGDYSIAAGRRAKIDTQHTGVFLFSDSNDSDFKSAAANEFAVRATGGVRLVTAIDVSGNPTAGVRLSKGSGSWESLSDRASKTNIVAVDARQVLAQLMSIPVSTWSYKTEDPSIRHIGPMAQDLHSFGMGEDDKYINNIDANGVALAAIQGLYQVVQEEDKQIADQERQISSLQAQVTTMESRLTALEQKATTNRAPTQSPVGGLTSDWPLLSTIVLIGLLLLRRSRVG